PPPSPPRSRGTRTPRETRQSGVERLDLGGEVLLADAPLQLQCRRDLVFFGAEVARQDRETLDLLEARELLVDVLDDARDVGLRLLAGDAFGERDQCSDVRTTVADDEGLRDQRVRLPRVLEVLGR